MSENYEAEQKLLKSRVAELCEQIATQQENSANADSFLSLVRKYSDITELKPEIIREFMEHIEIFKPEQINGNKVAEDAHCMELYR